MLKQPILLDNISINLDDKLLHLSSWHSQSFKPFYFHSNMFVFVIKKIF